MATKWDMISMDEQIDLESMDFADGKRTCGGCGELLVTEGDFARHFIIPNPQYKNLGYCPVKGPNKFDYFS